MHLFTPSLIGEDGIKDITSEHCWWRQNGYDIQVYKVNENVTSLKIIQLFSQILVFSKLQHHFSLCKMFGDHSKRHNRLQYKKQYLTI